MTRTRRTRNLFIIRQEAGEKEGGQAGGGGPQCGKQDEGNEQRREDCSVVEEGGRGAEYDIHTDLAGRKHAENRIRFGSQDGCRFGLRV